MYKLNSGRLQQMLSQQRTLKFLKKAYNHFQQEQHADKNDVALMQSIKTEQDDEAKNDLIYEDYQLHEVSTLLKTSCC